MTSSSKWARAADAARKLWLSDCFLTDCSFLSEHFQRRYLKYSIVCLREKLLVGKEGTLYWKEIGKRGWYTNGLSDLKGLDCQTGELTSATKRPCCCLIDIIREMRLLQRESFCVGQICSYQQFWWSKGRDYMTTAHYDPPPGKTLRQQLKSSLCLTCTYPLDNCVCFRYLKTLPFWRKLLTNTLQIHFKIDSYCYPVFAKICEGDKWTVIFFFLYNNKWPYSFNYNTNGHLKQSQLQS